MKVMVNGATGLVGLSIVDAFLEAGHTVRASDRVGSDFSELEKRNLEIIPADVDDLEALGKTVSGMDVVVHVAGLFDFAASPELLDKINHQGTRNICEAVLKEAPDITRFVQVSSVGVYGKPVRCPAKEDDPKRPRNPYEASKWKGEMAAFEYHKKHGLPVTAIRPTLIYGPRAKYGHAIFISALSLQKASGRDTMYGLRSGPKSSHVHVEDVGRAALLVAEKDGSVGNAYNVADPNPIEGHVFIKALAEPLGMQVKEVIPYIAPLMAVTGTILSLLPNWIYNKISDRLGKRWDKLREERGLSDALRLRLDRDWTGYMTGENFYDVTKLKELGMQWKWPDAKEGLRATIEWYKDKEWIP